MNRMSKRHLKKGSSPPVLQPGVLRCYSMKFCPFAQRAILVLEAKNIPYDMINVNLMERPSWLAEKNPLGKVPILEKDGELMCESIIICDYLEEKFPNKSLYPKSHWQKAKDKFYMERLQKVFLPLFKMMFYTGKEDINVLFKNLRSGLDIFENELRKRGTTFFFGSEPGMLDYMFWPFAERLPILELVKGETFLPHPQQLPALSAWFEAMLEDDAVRKTFNSAEKHLTYLAERNPDFEYMQSNL